MKIRIYEPYGESAIVETILHEWSESFSNSDFQFEDRHSSVVEKAFKDAELETLQTEYLSRIVFYADSFYYLLLLILLKMFVMKVKHSTVNLLGNLIHTSNDTSVPLVDIFYLAD